MRALRSKYPKASVAIETNGTRAVPDYIDWICVSPKVDVGRLVQRSGDELKVVVPGHDPACYGPVLDDFDHLWVSAAAETSSVGRSVVVHERLSSAAAWCLANPRWKLTLQSHKVIGVR